MIASSDDIKAMFEMIRRLLKDLEENRSKSLLKKADPETIAKYMRLEQLLTIFQNINDQALKQIGVTEDEINRAINPKYHEGGKLDPLVQEADKLRCDVLISEAAFIRDQFKEVVASNRPFAPTSKVVRDSQASGQKKAIKKKFKKMREGNKWKKI